MPAKRFGLKYVNSLTGHISNGTWQKHSVVGNAVVMARSKGEEMIRSGADVMESANARA